MNKFKQFMQKNFNKNPKKSEKFLKIQILKLNHPFHPIQHQSTIISHSQNSLFLSLNSLHFLCQSLEATAIRNSNPEKLKPKRVKIGHSGSLSNKCRKKASNFIAIKEIFNKIFSFLREIFF